MRLATLAGICVLTSAACAQWTTNLSANTPIADFPNDQAVPKVSARGDGGCYIGWFDHRGPNYDVYLQRVDKNGYDVWTHNGILVSGHPQGTSLVDWDLITTINGHALLVFTDLRALGDLDVYAYLIDEAGNFLWGPNGITLSNDAEYEANPVVAEMTDGTFVFAWNRSILGSTSRLVMQKVDFVGQLLFGLGYEILGGPTDDPGFVGIVPAPAAGFILSWVRDTIPISGAARHLWSQKYDANGVAQWPAGPIAVYDGAFLPIAYKPEVQADGAGGAWYAWYSSVGAFFEGRAQRLDTNGAEVFAHNGVEISLEPSRSELTPSFVQDGSGGIVVFYNKRNSSQSSWGIAGQRISSTGALLWGANGLDFAPYDAVAEEAPRALAIGNDFGFFVEQGNFGTTLVGARVNGSGVAQWTPSPLAACSLVSGKDKLRAIAASDGTAIVVWSDSRVDPNNVYAQNVEIDGSTGIPPAAVTPYGCGWNPPGSLAVLAGAPAINTNFTLGVTDPGGSMPSGSISLLAVSFFTLGPTPCGILVGNTGMAAPGAVGELLVDVGNLVVPVIVGNPWTGPGSPASFPFAVPNFPPAVGATVFMQGALFHAGSGRVGLSNAVALLIGP
jgi:hypothetical protein